MFLTRQIAYFLSLGYVAGKLLYSLTAVTFSWSFMFLKFLRCPFTSPRLGPERKWASLAAKVKSGTAHRLSPPFMGEITDPAGLSGHWAGRLGGGMVWVKWNCSLHPRQCIQTQISFSSVVLELLCWPQTSTKALLLMSDYLNWCLYGEDGIKFLLWHFANVTPQWYFALITFSNCPLNHKVYNYKWSL